MSACAVVKTGVVRLADSRIEILRRWPELPGIHVCRFDDCAGHPCIAACPVEAIAERDGLRAIDREACTGCEACVEACPYHAIRMDDGGPRLKCDFCAGEPGLREGLRHLRAAPSGGSRHGRRQGPGLSGGMFDSLRGRPVRPRAPHPAGAGGAGRATSAAWATARSSSSTRSPRHRPPVPGEQDRPDGRAAHRHHGPHVPPGLHRHQVPATDGTILNCYAGGFLGAEIKFCGIDGVVLEGGPPTGA